MAARSEEFTGGADSVRSPQFKSVQQMSNQTYKALSVLDNVLPNQNGLGAPDLQRKMVGSQGSPTGRSQATFDRQLWLRHAEPTSRAIEYEGQKNGQV